MAEPITAYFIDVIKKSKKPVISFKDNSYVIISTDELRTSVKAVDVTNKIRQLQTEYRLHLLFSRLPQEKDYIGKSKSKTKMVAIRFTTAIMTKSREKRNTPE